MNRDKTPEREIDSDDDSPDFESAMAVYSDTDMDPNRDDQRDAHHGADDEA